MKKIILLLVFSTVSFADVQLGEYQTVVNYQDCTRSSTQYENFDHTTMVFNCPEASTTVYLTKTTISIQNKIHGNLMINRCFIDELNYLEVSELWEMNVECLVGYLLQQTTFSWDNCKLISTESSSGIDPRKHNLHCEDLESNKNNDYYITISDTSIFIDYGLVQEYYPNCEMKKYDTIILNDRTDVDFEMLCFH